jgi:hypothetical protein
MRDKQGKDGPAVMPGRSVCGEVDTEKTILDHAG